MRAADIGAAAERLVARTCREQKLPLVVTDPAVLRRIAGLFNPTRDVAPGTEPRATANRIATTTTARKSRCLDVT